jgi:hypothetical protein
MQLKHPHVSATTKGCVSNIQGVSEICLFSQLVMYASEKAMHFNALFQAYNSLILASFLYFEKIKLSI